MINKRDIQMLDILIKSLKPRALVANHRVGAIVAKRKTIISFGYSSYKTHPLQARFGTNELAIHLHAEIDAIKNTLYHIPVSELSKCTIYIARIKKDGTVAMAMPCKGCMRAIEHFNLKRVVFTTNNGIEEL